MIMPCHDMEMFPMLLALCDGNLQGTVPTMQSFNITLDISLNKLLNKQYRARGAEMPIRNHSNDILPQSYQYNSDQRLFNSFICAIS